jgi:hypothetical protein
MNLFIGTTLTRSYQLMSGTTAAPVAIDLTGCAASFGLLSWANQRFLDCSTTDGTGLLTIPTPTNGTVVLDIPGSSSNVALSTAVLNPGQYFAALKITWSDGSVSAFRLEPINAILDPAT